MSGANDRTIKIFKIVYSFDKVLLRNRFDGCVLEKSIDDNAYVYSINNNLLDTNFILTGGSDSKIKLWNLASGIVEREIVGHKSPVSEIVLFENPFEKDLKRKNYLILSSGTSDECLRISNPISPINNGIVLSERIVNDWGASCSPTMQIVRDSFEDNIKIIVVS